MFCLRENIHSIGTTGDPHENSHRRKTLRVHCMSKRFHVQQAVKSSLEDPHWREAVFLRDMWEEFRVQSRPQTSSGK